MSAVIYFLPIIFWILFLIWFITSVKHDHFPWIIFVGLTAFMLIPVLNFVLFLALSVIALLCWMDMVDFSDILELKDNWFNRVFLGYNNE